LLVQQQIKDKINNLNVENARQKQALINEFKQSQELFKLKLNQSKQELVAVIIFFQNSHFYSII
jgi:hypothetical protein